MSKTLPGNPHAAEANTRNCVPDAYVQTQASLALAHEVRTLTLVLLESHVAAHGQMPTNPQIEDIIRRLGS